MIKMKVTGVSAAILGFETVNAILGKRFQRALHKAGQFVKDESAEIVPVKTGALRKSRSNRNIGGQGWKAEQVVSYGNADVRYATIVHEVEEYKHAPPTRSKYLSSVIVDRQAEIRAIIAREMAI